MRDAFRYVTKSVAHRVRSCKTGSLDHHQTENDDFRSAKVLDATVEWMHELAGAGARVALR